MPRGFVLRMGYIIGFFRKGALGYEIRSPLCTLNGLFGML